MDLTLKSHNLGVLNLASDLLISVSKLINEKCGERKSSEEEHMALLTPAEE